MDATTGRVCADQRQFRALTQAAFRLTNLLTAERDRLVADLGLTSARWQVLETLGLQSAPASAAQIARALHISRQAVQRVLNDLAQQGLVQRTAAVDDKRAQGVAVTPRGADLLLELDRRAETLRENMAGAHHAAIADWLALANGDIAPLDPRESPVAATKAALSSAPPDKAPSPWPTRARGAAITKLSRTFESVQDHILGQVRAGHLKSGDRLPPERELASSLGVGRSAVREALRSLEMSGILRFKRGVGGGAFVRESGSEGIETSIRSMLILGRLPLTDLLEVRASLLGQCARLGAQRGTAQDFARLDQITDALEHSIRTHNDQALAIKPATEFYRLAARCSHNPLMILLVDAIADLVVGMLTRLDHPPSLDSVTARRHMVAAMREGRADDAAKVIRLHSQQTNRLLLKSDDATAEAPEKPYTT